MKYKSVSAKLNLAVIGTSLVSLVIGFFVLFWYAQQIKTNVYDITKEELILSAEDRIESKMRVGITNAISIANDDRIKTALKTNNRLPAINSLKDISSKMKEHTEFKNIKIHLHTKENKSFLRNWKLDKYGDDLSSFRAAVVSVNKTLTPISTFEPGREGLLLRGITTITDNNGEHLGSLEFIQGINSVVKAFDKTREGFLLLMDQNVNDDIKTGVNFSFNDDAKFKNYVISQKYVNRDFLQDAQSLDMQKLFKNGFSLSSKYFYAYDVIKDFQDKQLGIVLLGKPLSVVNSAIDGAENLIYMALGGILAMTLLISLVIMVVIRKLVVSPLKKFEDGLNDFFLFLQGKKEYAQTINIDTQDEFGTMAKSLKENIAVSAKLHKEIGELNANLEKRVVQKTKKVTTLLDNAGQGFLSFGCDFIVDEEYSIECKKFLGEEIAKKDIADLLFKDEKQKAFFKKTLLDANDIEDDTVKKAMLSLLPSEVLLNKRALKLEYKMIEDEKIMLIVTNISSQKKLEKKIKREQETLKMIVEIVSESDLFHETKNDYEGFMNSYVNFIDYNKTSLHNVSEIYRIIHTFKGAFSQFYMNSIVAFLHSLESQISLMIKENKHTNETLLELLKKSDFRSNLDNELKTIQNILGKEFLNSQSSVKISYSQIKTLQNKIYSMFEQEQFETEQAKDIIAQVTNLSNQKLLDLLKSYPHLVQQLAPKLGKEVYGFEIIGNEDVVVSEKYKPFIKSLVHIFRNCVDHGIEKPETRLQNGKDETGTISCSFERMDDAIQIVISDDGAGIDKEKVLAQALYQNIITPTEASFMSDEDAYDLIFNEQLSTKDEVSEVSGRGIGMNAVKHELAEIHGTIKVNTKKNSGTTFIFTFTNK